MRVKTCTTVNVFSKIFIKAIRNFYNMWPSIKGEMKESEAWW